MVSPLDIYLHLSSVLTLALSGTWHQLVEQMTIQDSLSPFTAVYFKDAFVLSHVLSLVRIHLS